MIQISTNSTWKSKLQEQLKFGRKNVAVLSTIWRLREMKQQHLKILRYNTGTDKKAFVQFKDFFDAAIYMLKT